jgi:hypothetical protein
MKQELTVDESATLRSTPTSLLVSASSDLAAILAVLLGPLVLAVMCYLLVRRAI